jgi:hypothetical protein
VNYKMTARVQVIDQTEMEELFQDDIDKALCPKIGLNYETGFKDKNEEWKDMMRGKTKNTSYEKQHEPFYRAALEEVRIGLLPEVMVCD